MSGAGIFAGDTTATTGWIERSVARCFNVGFSRVYLASPAERPIHQARRQSDAAQEAVEASVSGATSLCRRHDCHYKEPLQ